MEHATFTLIAKNDRKLFIHMRGTNLHVSVKEFKRLSFKLNADKLNFFATWQDLTLLFQADFNPVTIDNVAAAIQWYAAEVLKTPGMELSMVDPRPVFN